MSEGKLIFRNVILLIALCGPAVAQDRPASVARTRLEKLRARIYQLPKVDTWRFSIDASGFPPSMRTPLKLTPESKYSVRWNRHARSAGGLTVRAEGLAADQALASGRRVLPYVRYALMPHYLTAEPRSLINRHLTLPYKSVVQGADKLIFTPQFRTGMTRSEIRFDPETEQIRQIVFVTARGNLTVTFEWTDHKGRWLLKRLSQRSTGQQVDIRFRYKAIEQRMLVSHVDATSTAGEKKTQFSLSPAAHKLGIQGAGMQTPRGVFAKAVGLMKAKDYHAFARCLTPNNRDQMNMGLIAVAGFATMGQDRKPDPAKRKLLEKIFRRYRLTPLLTGNQDRAALEKAVQAVKQKAWLLDDLIRFAAKHGRRGSPLGAANLGILQDDVKITGDRATATVKQDAGGKQRSKPIAFRKIDGIWLIAIGG